MEKIRAGIIGAAGYTAGELIRLLLRHPRAEIVSAQSSSHAGSPVTKVHSDLAGETDLIFTPDADLQAVDILFLCQGHGKSAAFLSRNPLPGRVKVVDLSTDFRIQDGTHDFIYGLPELHRESIRSAVHVANPGCFATGIQLALLPLAASGNLNAAVHIHAITGSTGAGQQPSETTHFSWREGNISAYKVFSHQHQGEILQGIRHLQPEFNQDFNFIPIRGNFTRGIFVTAYTQFRGSLQEAGNLYETYYRGHPFSVMTTENPHLKQVVNTNKALIYLEKHDERLVIITCTDNLLKGASGQAVQNMNLMFGLDETTGLWIKPVAF